MEEVNFMWTQWKKIQNFDFLKPRFENSGDLSPKRNGAKPKKKRTSCGMSGG
jgi:hypothetical protein